MAENRKRDQIQWVSSGDPSTVDDSRMMYPGQLGCIYTDDQGKEWRYVQGDSTMSVAPFPGATMFWADKANYKVTTSATNRGLVAGVIPCFQKDGTTRVASKSKGGFFFIGRGGKHKIKFIDAVTSTPDGTGKMVVPSSTTGKADCIALGSNLTAPMMGRTIGTYDAVNAECDVDIDIPDSQD